MKLAATLQDVKGAASTCLRCSWCSYGAWPENLPLCPIYSRFPSFTFSGGGYLFLALALLENKIDFNQSVADFAFSCSGCNACDAKCNVISSHKSHLQILDAIRVLRNESVKRGFVPEGPAKKILEDVKTGRRDASNPLELPRRISDEKAATVIFTGYAQTRSQKAIDAALVGVLEKIGAPVMQFAEQGYSAPTLYDFGFWDELEPLVKDNRARMTPLQNGEFVFTDPHSQEFVVRRYPEIVPGSRPVRARHISQLLEEAFKQGKLKGRNTGKIKVSYHDPCYLGRGLGIYDSPRNVLGALEGVALVEMNRNRQNSFCCGARTLGNYLPDLPGETARERLGEFEATGADLLITACAFCKDQFQKIMPAKDRARVKDLVELVNERT